MDIETRAATLNERPEACHLINLAFDAEGYGPALDNPTESVGYSHMDPHDRAENTRILLLDGEIISVVHVADRHVYACGEIIPIGFIAMVATHPDHRRKGYARQLLADAEIYMQERGFCYAELLGGFKFYSRLRWRWCGEKFPTLSRRYSVSTRTGVDVGLNTRLATEGDISFLSEIYEARYGRRFGMVVRSYEYWRRWSLKCHWEGTYIVVCDGAAPVGYFHITDVDGGIDEIGWRQDRQETQKQVFLAALLWGFERGNSTIDFYVDDFDELVNDALYAVFCRPNGQATEDPDPRPYLPENWPDGMGIMVKFLNSGQGILADVNDTDALTEAMAQYSWGWFDGDTM